MKMTSSDPGKNRVGAGHETRWLSMAMEVEDVNGVPTHVFNLTGRARSRGLVLVVPGSPGMGHFYIPFATKLFQLGSGRFDVSVVSHAGHSPGVLRTTCAVPAVEGGGISGAGVWEAGGSESDGDRDWFCLEEQVAHKMAFLEERVREKEELYLVGHSIGCYMILHMLQRLAPERVKKAVLLFPTIERMSLTPNGQKLAPMFSTLRSPLTYLVGLCSWIPVSIKQFVLQRYFHTTPVDHREHITQAVMNIDGRSMHNILCMAHQEVQQVAELPREILDSHVDKLAFYYGVNDMWTLESCYEEMAERFPDKDINLCCSGHAHAFVLSASNEMADFVFSRLQINREAA